MLIRLVLVFAIVVRCRRCRCRGRLCRCRYRRSHPSTPPCSLLSPPPPQPPTPTLPPFIVSMWVFVCLLFASIWLVCLLRGSSNYIILMYNKNKMLVTLGIICAHLTTATTTTTTATTTLTDRNEWNQTYELNSLHTHTHTQRPFS